MKLQDSRVSMRIKVQAGFAEVSNFLAKVRGLPNTSSSSALLMTMPLTKNASDYSTRLNAYDHVRRILCNVSMFPPTVNKAGAMELKSLSVSRLISGLDKLKLARKVAFDSPVMCERLLVRVCHCLRTVPDLLPACHCQASAEEAMSKSSKDICIGVLLCTGMPTCCHCRPGAICSTD